MAKDAHKKPILESTPPELVGDSQPSFRQGDFEEALFSKGYEVYVEKAIYCPCKNKADGKPLTNCQNCGGTGWVFIDKKSTRLVVQSINRETKFHEWTEQDRGTIQITARGEDRLAFMDRITLLDVDAIFGQVVRVRKHKTKCFAFLFYQPIEVEEAYLFTSVDEALTPLVEGTHYSIEENRLNIIDKSLVKKLGKDEDSFYTISIRYKHLPTYNIIDINRDIMRNRDKTCGVEALQEMPINSIARKTHYMMDEPNLSGESLFDNTVY